MNKKNIPKDKQKISSKQHFDLYAEAYDNYKKNNWYYYKNLKKIPFIYLSNPKKNRVLEIGCGTGQILANINPQYGVGIDISKNMIDIAKRKYGSKNIKFKVANAEKLQFEEKFDIVIMTDVVEHLNDFGLAIKNIKKCMHKDSIILITTANPLWTSILELGEKLKLKMEEGPHKWISQKSMAKILKSRGFKILKLDTFLLVPIYIPLLSEMINNLFWRIPVLRKLGLIQVVIAKI